MSYKSDMEMLRRESKRRKKKLILLMKITVIALAVAILITAIGAFVNFLLEFDHDSDRDEDNGQGVKDYIAPVIVGPEGDTALAYVGDSIAYKSFIQASDNSGSFQIMVDASNVNVNAAGTYTVKYTVKDGAGNESRYTMTLVIKSREYTYDSLMTLVGSIAPRLEITDSMTTVQKVRAIHDFVNDPGAGADTANIKFKDDSNAPAQKAQTGYKDRVGWEVDWIEEAYLTLSMSRMTGDCYSYYSVSKAFFEYYGIPNEGIQRSTDSTESGTHYWNAVNVGTASNPQWYFYDATRLGGSFTDGTRNACLVTYDKLRTYTTSKGGTQFYLIDDATFERLPKMSTNPLP